MSYTDVVVDFNASLIGSNLKAKYILFEKKKQGYNHLCVAEDRSGKQYAESFFIIHRICIYAIKGQSR